MVNFHAARRLYEDDQDAYNSKIFKEVETICSEKCVIPQSLEGLTKLLKHKENSKRLYFETIEKIHSAVRQKDLKNIDHYEAMFVRENVETVNRFHDSVLSRTKVRDRVLKMALKNVEMHCQTPAIISLMNTSIIP